MAGCDCRKDIFKITYDNLTSEVASQHSNWTPTEVRQETSRLFRPSFHQNMDSVKRERSNEKIYKAADFIFEDGKINFIDGLRTRNILTFHETQLRDTPKEYSPEQHQVSILIQTAFQKGASEVVTSYPEKSGQRDILVMKLDRETGKGTSFIINTAPGGDDHTVSEIETIAKSYFGDLVETKATKEAFILSDVTVPEQSAQRVFQNINRTIQELPGEAVHAIRSTVSEISYTASSIRRYVENIQVKEVINPQPQEMKSIVNRVFSNHQTEIVVKLPTGVQKEKDLVKFKQKVVETPMVVFTSTKRIEKKKIISVSKKATEKSIVRHERKVKRKIVKLEARRGVLLHEEFRVRKSKEKKLKFRIEKRTRRGTSFAETKQLKKRNATKEISFRKHIEKIGKEFPHQLLTLIKRFIRVKEQAQSIKVEKKRKAQENVLNFSITFMFWTILRHPLFISRSKCFHVSIHESKIVRLEDNQKQEPLKYNKSEAPVSREPTQWILLAIIWYLAMIREQGQTQSLAINNLSPVKKKTITTLTSQLFPLPPRGVIFAFVT